MGITALAASLACSCLLLKPMQITLDSLYNFDSPIDLPYTMQYV